MAERMSETEALLWGVEQDPNLASTMGSVLLLEAVPDAERLSAAVSNAVASVDRLRQRVVEAPGRLGPPEWAYDHAFDLEHHLRHLHLPAPGNDAQLRRLASQFIADPFDRTRPLWQLLLITGLSGERAALVAKLHHCVTDGTGALVLAQHLLDLSADAPPPAPVDLAEVLEADRLIELDAPGPNVTEQIRRGAERALRAMGEAASALADPLTAQRVGNQALTTLRALAAQLPGGERHTSPLWSTRSPNRRLEWLTLPLEPARERARQLGGSLNDLFVTAVLDGSVAYHRHFDVEVDKLTATIVISTRSGDKVGLANAFTPAAAVLNAGRGIEPSARFRLVSEVLAQQKEAARRAQDAVGPVTGLVSLLPAGLATGIALDQAARVDFATSNLRGLPVPVWVGGSRLDALYPVGPAGGTAFNITLMSNLDRLHIGLNIDPVAVADPALLARCIAEGFARLGVDTGEEGASPQVPGVAG